MATDMDIDMDLGIEDDDLMEHVEALHHSAPAEPEFASGSISQTTSDQEPTQIAPHKVHLRGLDNLTTSDVKGFATEYFDSESCERIEWIDDTSANLVYSTPETALQALAAFTSRETDSLDSSALLLLPAKSFPGHPDIRLQARLAVIGDRKQAGARDRSRFYLFNPEHDPAEKMKKNGDSRKGRRSYRERDDDGYRSQVYDHREHRRRQEVEEFDASLYDDDAAALATRTSKQSIHNRSDSRSSLSSGEHTIQGGRRVRFSGNGKELFPGRVTKPSNGRLRDRSASPLRGDGDDNMQDISTNSGSRLARSDNSSSSNRLNAQIIKSRLRDMATVPKELFPQKAGISHKRSGAFDAADVTADLFADRMMVPFVDGSSDVRPNNSDLRSRITKIDKTDRQLSERISSANTSDQSVFNIRGVAKQQPAMGGFAIKGTAMMPAESVTELFPSRFGANAGKELFSDKLEGRGGRRRRAEDMFQ